MPALPELRFVSSLQDPVAACAALEPAGARAVSLDSSGDTAFALLAAGAERVVVVVPDPATAALVHLKLAALRALPVQSVRSLLGVGTPGRRVWFYHHIRPLLPEPARRWWDARESLVREGIVDAGGWESLLARYRGRVLSRVPGRAVLSRIFDEGAVGDGSAAAGIDSPVWRLGTRFALAGPVRRAQHLCGAHPPVAPFDLRVRDLLREGRAGENFQLVQLFLGAWPRAEVAPPYLTPRGHAGAAAVADRVEVFVGPSLPPGQFDAVDLALSVDELPARARPAFFAEIAAHLRSGGRLAGAWWNGSPPWTFDAPQLAAEPGPGADRSPFTGGSVVGRRR